MYTKKEINILLDNMVIVVDTREQENKHILEGLRKNHKKYVCKKLDVGDYAAYIECNIDTRDIIKEDLYFNTVIERKGSLNELIGNFVDRTRIEKEFIRAKENGIKVYLMLEEEQAFKKLLMGKYRSRYSVSAAKGTFFSFLDRYNLNVIYTGKTLAAATIYNILYYSIRNKLKE